MKKILVKYNVDSVKLILLEDNNTLRHGIVDILHSLNCSFILTDKGMTFILGVTAYSLFEEYIPSLNRPLKR